MSTLRNILLGSKRRRAVTLLGIVACMCAAAVELACQTVAFVQFRKMDGLLALPENYVQRSATPGMTYELKPGADIKKTTGEHIHINTLAFREDTDELFADKRRVAIFGDSVAQGVGVTQEATISSALQREIDPEIKETKVINAGLLGLGLSELPAWLKRVLAVYKPQQVVYILNPNDFVLRDSLYEGADGGLYRMFERPVFKTPLVVRKALYKFKKGGISPSTGWYRWTFDGTKGANLPKIAELKGLCDQAGAKFHVVLMPIRGSFGGDATIKDIYREISAFMTANKIDWSDPAAAFAAAGATGAENGDKLIDFSDHYTPEGGVVMARALKPLVSGSGASAEGREQPVPAAGK